MKQKITTYSIIFISTIVYAITTKLQLPLQQLAVNYNNVLTTNEYWLIVSSVFVHVNFYHLCSNLLSMYSIGIVLEPIIRKRLFIVTFLKAASVAILVSILFKKNIYTCGISGGVFGLFGFIIALAKNKYYNFSVVKINTKLLYVTTALNIIIGFYAPSVNVLAHVVGLTIGWYAGITHLAKILNTPPKIYYTKLIPPPFRAITLPPFGIFIKPQYKGDNQILQHDLIHWQQYKRMGLFVYYLRYFVQLIFIGYDTMPMEMEARQHDTIDVQYNYRKTYHSK